MCLKSKLFCTSLYLILLLVFCAGAHAQSGRGAMHGYVAFQDIAYNDLDKQKVHAKVELKGNTEFNQTVLTTETNERGSYDIKDVPMGEYVLRISMPGYKTYETELYIPSDFTCSLATMLKKAPGHGEKEHKPSDK